MIVVELAMRLAHDPMVDLALRLMEEALVVSALMGRAPDTALDSVFARVKRLRPPGVHGDLFAPIANPDRSAKYYDLWTALYSAQDLGNDA